MSEQTNASAGRDFDTADVYVEAASIQVSGRTLRRWCDDNAYLAEGIGRMKLPGKDLFDTRTAPRFREIWIDAERRKQADLARAEAGAKRRIRPKEAE
jgi:hypothetical protein